MEEGGGGRWRWKSRGGGGCGGFRRLHEEDKRKYKITIYIKNMFALIQS